MTLDIRLSVDFFGHRKTQKLRKRLGAAGVESLIKLWMWARPNRPSGDLSGLDNEDIAICAGWDGAEDLFAETLASIGWLDGEAGKYALHDWLEHNPWAAGSEARSDEARFLRLAGVDYAAFKWLKNNGVNRISKKDYEAIGVGGDPREMETWRYIWGAGGEALEQAGPGGGDDLLSTCRQRPVDVPPTQCQSSVDVPSTPVPNPEETKNTPLPPSGEGGVCDAKNRENGKNGEGGFTRLWEIYPRREAPRAAEKAYRRLRRKNLLPPDDELVAAVLAQKSRDPTWLREPFPRFVPRLDKWLEGGQWANVPPGAEPGPAELAAREAARKARTAELAEAERLRAEREAETERQWAEAHPDEARAQRARQNKLLAEAGLPPL